MRWGEEAPLDSKEAAPCLVLSASHGVGFACGQRLLTVRYEGFFSFAVEVTNICAGMYFIHFLDFRKGRLKNSTVFLSCIMLLHNMFFINFLKGFFFVNFLFCCGKEKFSSPSPLDILHKNCHLSICWPVFGEICGGRGTDLSISHFLQSLLLFFNKLSLILENNIKKTL